MRLAGLLDKLSVGRTNGRYEKLLKQLAKSDALVIADWGLAALTNIHRCDLLEVFDDRHGARSHSGVNLNMSVCQRTDMKSAML